MKYYIVALLDDESYKSIEPLQRNIARKYRLSRGNSTFHIPLSVIDNPNMDKFDEIISNILKPYKTFKVELGSTLFSDENAKTFSLEIENKGYIKRLSRVMNDTLKLHGFSVRDIETENSMYVALNNINSISKDLNKTYNNLSPNVKMIKINRIELWKSTGGKKEFIIKTYPLKTF